MNNESKAFHLITNGRWRHITWISFLISVVAVLMFVMMNSYIDWKSNVDSYDSWSKSELPSLCKERLALEKQARELCEIQVAKKYKSESSTTTRNIFEHELYLRECVSGMLPNNDTSNCSPLPPGDLTSKFVYSIDNVQLFPVVIFLWLCLLVFAFALRCVLKEPHIGWRRLTLVMTPVTAAVIYSIMRPSSYKTNPFELGLLAYTSLVGSALVFIYLRRLFNWVVQGFKPNSVSNSASSLLSKQAGGESRHSMHPEQMTDALKPEALLASPADQSRDVPKVAEFWPRLWARCIDLPLLWVLLSIIGALGPSFREIINGPGGVLFDLIFWMFVFCILVYLHDSFLVNKFGSTLGKKIFGLRVQSTDLRLPTRDEAKRRAMKQLTSGLYFMLWFPYLQGIAAFTVWRSRNAATAWDLSSRTFVQQKKISQFRYYVGVIFAVILISLTIVGQRMAKEITREELRSKTFD